MLAAALFVTMASGKSVITHMFSGDGKEVRVMAHTPPHEQPERVCRSEAQ